MKKKKCLNCKNKFDCSSETINRPRKFCSQTCANIYNQRNGSWNKGISHTKEEKQKISDGVKNSRPVNWINPSTRLKIREKI